MSGTLSGVRRDTQLAEDGVQQGLERDVRVEDVGGGQVLRRELLEVVAQDGGLAQPHVSQHDDEAFALIDAVD